MNVLAHIGLTPERVRKIAAEHGWLSTRPALAETRLRKPYDYRKRRSARRAAVLKQLTPTVTHPEIVALARRVAAKRNVPLNAALSRTRIAEVVAVRHEIWRAALKRGMRPNDIAAAFGVHSTAINHALAK